MKHGRLGRAALRIIATTFVLGLCACPNDGGSRRATPYYPYNTHLMLLGTGNKCIVTQYTSNIDSYASIASDNHQAYAHFHGYHYSAFRGRISGARFHDPEHPERLYRDGLYWQKVAAVQHRLRARNPESGEALCRWVMWVDADVLFTNFERTLEDILAPWETPDINPGGDPKDVVMPRDSADTIVNAGVFFVKNTPEGRAFIDTVASRYETYKRRELPEQEAMQDYLFNSDLHTPGRCDYNRVGANLRHDAAVMPQRSFNSFYKPDERGGRVHWEKCDFIAHFASLNTQTRVEHMHRVIGELEPCEE